MHWRIWSAAALATAAVAVGAAVRTAAVEGQPGPIPRGEVTQTPTPSRTPTPSITPTSTPPAVSRIGIYANAAGTDCDLNTGTFFPFNVFVIAKGVPGLRAANFRVETEVNVFEVAPSRTPHPEATVTGNPLGTGTNVTFANCKDVLPLQIFRMTFVTSFAGTQEMAIEPSGGEACPFILECDGTTEFCVTPGSFTINGTQPCSDPSTPTSTRTPSPTRTLTSTRTPTSGPSPTSTRTPTASSTPTLTPSQTSTPSTTPTPSNTPTPSLTPTVTNTPVCGPGGYDSDLNGEVLALSDGLLTLRHLFGFTGSVLTLGALEPDAQRTDPAAITAYLDCIRLTLLDADGNGVAEPLSDGLLLLRYFFGFRGQTLVSNVIGNNCTRCDAESIEAFIASGLS